MFTQLITHVERTKEAFLAIKNDIFNLFAHIQGINGRLTIISEKLIIIEKRLNEIDERTSKTTPHTQLDSSFRITNSTNPLNLLDSSVNVNPNFRQNMGISTGRLIGNTNSGKVHRDTCVFAKKILPEHRLELDNQNSKNMTQHGFGPCVCLEV